MYRLLHGAGEVRERRRQRSHPWAEPPRLVATAPKQVWTWDITCLAGSRRGGRIRSTWCWICFALCRGLDVATRKIARRARRLIRAACLQQAIEPEQLTLHQDRGAPMTAKSFSQLFVDLDIRASYSRPRTTDDNAVFGELVRNDGSLSCFDSVRDNAVFPATR